MIETLNFFMDTLTQNDFENLPTQAKSFFSLEEDGKVVPIFEPDQVQETQDKLRQDVILAQQRAVTIENKLKDFLNVLPKEFQNSPKELGNYFAQTKQNTLNKKPEQQTQTLEQQTLEEKLRERDIRHQEKIKSLEQIYAEEKKLLEEENNKLKHSEAERIALQVMQVAARKHKLNPKYDTQFFRMNRERFGVNENKLFITDPDGLASGTTVDKFFADQKEKYGEMFMGTGMSGSGMMPNNQIQNNSQGQVKRNNLDLLLNIADIAKGNKKVV